jgi:probable 2-oxoglutarate dehydrogenase E1 component DHKTD1
VCNNRSIPDTYCDNLIEEGILNPDYLKENLQNHTNFLNENLAALESHTPSPSYLKDQWSEITVPEESITTWDTGIDISLLKYIGMRTVDYPEHFVRHKDSQCQQ